MSQQLINRSPDLRALENDGYEIDIRSGHLVIYNVPYVNSKKAVRRGTLVSTLDLAGDVTNTPSTHVVLFEGEFPCDQEGREIGQIRHQSQQKVLCEGLTVDHSFSSKPTDGQRRRGYTDYYEKMTAYIAIISSPAQAIDPNASARTHAVIEAIDQNSVFNYIDTASSRAGITGVSKKLELTKIAIVGLGGTGAYILDLVAKTPVSEIHLFDDDDFIQHNAFRSPGAASIDELRRRLKKVHYLAVRYAPMRKGIISHELRIEASNVDRLQDMDFVFICVDKGSAKQPIVEKLAELDTPFIDVGIGVNLVEDRLQGLVRVTTSTATKRDHVHDKHRIGLTDGDVDDEYSKNIQIADLNALNAALAVIKWKKLFGFYMDLEQEHFSVYTLDGNLITNEDRL